jgi:hypothetical protein
MECFGTSGCDISSLRRKTKPKPATATILITILLFIFVASVFFTLAYTVGKKEEPAECTGFICPDPPKGGNSEKTGEKVICGVLLSTFGILGIVGNILSIIVFTRPSMKKSGNSIIFCALAVFDGLFVLSVVISFGLTKIIDGNFDFSWPLKQASDAFLTKCLESYTHAVSTVPFF